MKILGLDISTSVTAYTLIDTEVPQSHSVIEYDGIHLSKQKSLYDKAELIRDCFEKINQSHQIDRICAEESLQAFRRGMSSAKTLSTLTTSL